MSKIETIKVTPRQEKKWYEVEVYVGFYSGGTPVVNAGIVGARYPATAPTVESVKRYVFEVEAPAQLKAIKETK